MPSNFTASPPLTPWRDHVTMLASDTERHEIKLPTSIRSFALSSDHRFAYGSKCNGTVYILKLDVPAKAKAAGQ